MPYGRKVRQVTFPFRDNRMNSFTFRSQVMIAALVFPLAGCRLAHEHDRGPETVTHDLTVLDRAALADGKHAVSFAKQVKPILESKCLACHSGDPAPGIYRLESKSLAFASGPAGPRILPGRPDQSPILAFASTHKNVATMPAVGNQLTATEAMILRRWVAEGASWPGGWAGRLRPRAGDLRRERAW